MKKALGEIGEEKKRRLRRPLVKHFWIEYTVVDT